MRSPDGWTRELALAYVAAVNRSVLGNDASGGCSRVTTTSLGIESASSQDAVLGSPAAHQVRALVGAAFTPRVVEGMRVRIR